MAPRFDLTPTGLRELLGRIRRGQLEAVDLLFFASLVIQLIGRAERRQERAVAKIVAARGDTSGSEQDAGETSDGESTSDPPSWEADAAGSHEAQGQAPPKVDGQGGPTKRNGHGRHGARAFRNALHLVHALAAGVIGALCDACRIGKMSRYREKVFIQIFGQPLFRAEAHHCEQARCDVCGYIVRAVAPACVHEGVGSEYVRYDWSAGAMLMVMHYFAGAPFKRLESLHQGWGIPMPDANQWDVVNACDDLLLPLYRALERHAIQQATNFRIDDTGSMVIALRKQIEGEIAALQRLGESTKDVRTGINATGIYWETPQGPVIVYYTGRHHAGEVIDQLLRHRLTSSPKLVKCTDGASKNFDHEHGDELIEATCNAHALLKFREIKDKYPAEYAEAGRVYKQVFENDDKARDLGLNAIDRMLYHRRHSKPLMEELKKRCEAKIKSKLVEPNSPLWEPLTFVLNQWERLTRFCDVPGVPLDTNLVEQALIMPVRYLAGSFNYQSEDGAVVGDHAMSLIATARANGVEPVAYLSECLRNHEDLAKRPEHYLPWVFRERMKDEEEPARSPKDMRQSRLQPERPKTPEVIPKSCSA